MNRQEIAALLAYAARLDPRTTPPTNEEAAARLDQWAELLADVPATAHTGSGWDVARIIRDHIQQSPYPILPADIARRWITHRRAALNRHTDPTPNADPDNEQAYRAALLGDRRAVTTGQAPPAQYRAITATEDDIRAMRQQKDLRAWLRRSLDDARATNARRRALVNRYPDLAARIAALPGHKAWSGSVGGNAHTAAIVAEAEQRAAHTTQQPHAPHTATQHA